MNVDLSIHSSIPLTNSSPSAQPETTVNPIEGTTVNQPKKIVMEIIVEVSNEVGEYQYLNQSSDFPDDLDYEQPSTDFEDSNLDHQPNGAEKSVLTPGTPYHIDQSQGNQDVGPT